MEGREEAGLLQDKLGNLVSLTVMSETDIDEVHISKEVAPERKDVQFDVGLHVQVLDGRAVDQAVRQKEEIGIDHFFQDVNLVREWQLDEDPSAFVKQACVCL